MKKPHQVKLLPDRFRLAQTDRGDQVKLLPVRFRLAQADKRDITLSVSKIITSSESASDSSVTSADRWNNTLSESK